MPSVGNISNNYGMYGNTSMVNSSAKSAYTNSSMEAYGLDMSDFLSLMVAQFTNQTMDTTADINDMLNQLVQMQMVTALASMSTAMNTMTDASIMTYAASLVGKEITVAGYDADGNYQEQIGLVTATGSYGGEQVVFMGEDMYYMSQIIAVGRLPSTNAGQDMNTENLTGTTSGTTTETPSTELPTKLPTKLPTESNGRTNAEILDEILSGFGVSSEVLNGANNKDAN